MMYYCFLLSKLVIVLSETNLVNPYWYYSSEV